MGYNVQIFEIDSLLIPVSAEKEIIKTIKQNISERELVDLETLEDVFNYYGFEIIIEKGIVVVIEWQGGKAYDLDTLFQAVSPYVLNGGAIMIIGEDGAIWGYKFEKGQVFDTKCKMVKC